MRGTIASVREMALSFVIRSVVHLSSTHVSIAMTTELGNYLAINGDVKLVIILDVLPWRHSWELLLDCRSDFGIQFNSKTIVRPLAGLLSLAPLSFPFVEEAARS